MELQKRKDIFLKYTSKLYVPDFFKNKKEGGVFSFVDPKFYEWFDMEIQDSPYLGVANYEVIVDITEPKLVYNTREAGVYAEVDLAHIKQICEKQFVYGEDIFIPNRANIFFLRDKETILCRIDIWQFKLGEWWLTVENVRIAPPIFWSKGFTVFLLSEPQNEVVADKNYESESN